ncbi:hypothetical protein BASA50_002333 [Batrachochytrium salamandrivorans]|uniref:RRM domain-containing protein n=1 Tax=Batrachochytrium salamandrivorans TaxID=1357716 RepID=A0ABQ8FLM3_9FUNG|nr:hypothetical protein BASA62_001004 [Batrachochytrium salamandrivorans]KAH6600399.1 hypothetical protein BASA50_002333 [Batrachochytrium salamandrivorans]KAH6602850.1 hypothetical protein BASA61_000693 [Batrachochytrium salamandrivorans]KAH9263885.1 hypothetical protein BASA83_012669 [Batrachochytrium salamandrivorans]
MDIRVVTGNSVMNVDKELVYGSPGADSEEGLHLHGMSEGSRSSSRSPLHTPKGEQSTRHSPSRHVDDRMSPLITNSTQATMAPTQSETYSSVKSPTTKSAPVKPALQVSDSNEHHSGKPASSSPSTVVGAFGLSLFTTELELRGLFSVFGTITHCTIIRDAQTLRSRGFGFITFEEVESAVKSQKELNGTILNNRAMRVDFSISSRPHDPTPGFYKGKSTREGGSEGRRPREQGRPLYNPYPERRDPRRGRDMDREGRGPPLYRQRTRSPPPYYRGGHEGYGDAWMDHGERFVDRRMGYERTERERIHYGGGGVDYGSGPYRSSPRGASPLPMSSSSRYRGGYGEGKSRSPVYESRGRR